MPKIRKNDVFGRFGVSVGWPKGSAELFRPSLAEISAEISVSVVHYTWNTVKPLIAPAVTILFLDPWGRVLFKGEYY